MRVFCGTRFLLGKSNGVLYNIEHGGFFRTPGGLVHGRAWFPRRMAMTQ
jgi:hypothetical protein